MVSLQIHEWSVSNIAEFVIKQRNVFFGLNTILNEQLKRFLGSTDGKYVVIKIEESFSF